MEVFLYKADAMKRILHYVSHAYVRYTSGEVLPQKAHALSLKFEDRYGTHRTTQQRYRAKAKGHANAHLIMLFEKGSSMVCWWLMVTSGEGLIEQMEDLKDAQGRKSKIVFGGYELAVMPRKDRKPSWTWRMTSENKLAWKERLQVAVRARNDDLMKQALYSLKRTQGFAESRREAFELFNETKRYWRKKRGTDWPYGDIFVGFHGRHKKAITVGVKEISNKAYLKRSN